jgi:uncharacterized CHY-type Zn-finger protein
MAGKTAKSSLVVFILFMTALPFPFMGFAEAQNGTAFIDSTSINLSELEQIENEYIHLNFTIIEGSGYGSNVTIEYEVRSIEGQVIQNSSQSVSIDAAGTEQISKNVTSIPYGYNILNVSIFGDVGVNLSSSNPGILTFERIVQRLRPSNISIASVSGIYFESIDETLNPTGNNSLSDGDFFRMEIPLLNDGDYDWRGTLIVSFFDALDWNYTSNEIEVNASSTKIVQIYSPNGLIEGVLNWTIVLDNITGIQGVHSRSGGIHVGPPPLPLLEVESLSPTSNLSAGTLSNHSFRIWNNGSVSYSGVFSCALDGENISSQSIDVGPASNLQVVVEHQVRPGLLACMLTGQRIDEESVPQVTILYNMASAMFEIVGQSEPTAMTGPWNAGDRYHASMLIRNTGTETGHVNLVMSFDGVEQSGEYLELPPNSAGEVSINFELPRSGLYEFDWKAMTFDGAFSTDSSGIFSINVSESQTIDTEIIDIVWNEDDGLSFDVKVSMSEGSKREVHISYGTFTGTLEEQVGEFEIEISTGSVVLPLYVGQGTCEGVFVIVTPIDWVANPSRSVAMEEFEIEEPIYLVELDPLLTPRRPIEGDRTEVEISFQVTGYFIDRNSEFSILGPDGEVLFSGPAPKIQGTSQSATVTPEIIWPSNDEVQLNVVWLIEGKRIESTALYQSGEIIADDTSFEIPMLEVFYGVILGGVIIFVLRLKQNKLDMPQANVEKKASQKKKHDGQFSDEEKKTIDCPECARQLRIPHTYEGKVRCPDCEHSFEVAEKSSGESESPQKKEDEIKEEPNSTPNDGKKEISCPDCERSLRVPESYDGSVRCPACKCVFKAS